MYTKFDKLDEEFQIPKPPKKDDYQHYWAYKNGSVFGEGRYDEDEISTMKEAGCVIEYSLLEEDYFEAIQEHQTNVKRVLDDLYNTLVSTEYFGVMPEIVPSVLFDLATKFVEHDSRNWPDGLHTLAYPKPIVVQIAECFEQYCRLMKTQIKADIGGYKHHNLFGIQFEFYNKAAYNKTVDDFLRNTGWYQRRDIPVIARKLLGIAMENNVEAPKLLALRAGETP